MEEKTTIGKVAMKYGLILGLLSIVYFLVLSFAGVLGKTQVWSYLGIIFTIAVIYLAHKAFKEEGDGFMSYSQGLGIGTLICLYSSILSSIFTFVYISYVDDTMIQNIREKSIADMEARGMSPAQIDQAMGFSETFMSPGFMLIMGIVGGVLIGFIVSLIVSAITKNANPQMSE
jgi:O-antigen ligase